MAEVVETHLPGVGVRHEFTTAAGVRVGVVSHRSGRREIVVYDQRDPDAATAVLNLSSSDTRTLAELLGASQVSETISAVQHQLEGLAIDWVTVAPASPFAGRTIADGQFRTVTGVSVVAVVSAGSTLPAPGPDYRFAAGDVAVAVGTPEGLEHFRRLLA